MTGRGGRKRAASSEAEASPVPALPAERAGSPVPDAVEETAAGDSATETHREPHGAAAPHGSADDVPEHETDDDAGHAGHAEAEELGPIDVPGWAAGIAGVALGLLVVACLVVATRGLHPV